MRSKDTSTATRSRHHCHLVALPIDFMNEKKQRKNEGDREERGRKRKGREGREDKKRRGTRRMKGKAAPPPGGRRNPMEPDFSIPRERNKEIYLYQNTSILTVNLIQIWEKKRARMGDAHRWGESCNVLIKLKEGVGICRNSCAEKLSSLQTSGRWC